MKIRTDFVTNSSSSSFCVAITVNGKDNTSYKLSVDPTDEYLGGGGEALLDINEKKIFGASDVDTLLAYLTDNIEFDDADCAFEEFDVETKDYSVKSIRKVLKKCDVPYFQSVMEDIDCFRNEVKSALPAVSDIASICIEKKHKAWGEFSDLVEGYLPDIGIEVPEDGDSWLEGKTFVVTGKLKYFANREELVEYIEEEGGRVSESVNKNTDYLINNDFDSVSSKNKKAAQLGIPVITEETFLKRFCDSETLDEEIAAEIGEFYDYHERVVLFLKEKLSAESNFEEIADCLEEYCEPESYTGIITTVYNIESKTSVTTNSIVMDME